jgi:hypothetical protein
VDILLFWLPLIASILLGGVAASAWYGGDKTLSLWVAFGGVVLLLLTAAIQLQIRIISGASDATATRVPDKATITAQRAYVLVSDATISDLAAETPPTVSVTIKNTGTTPAYDLTWRAIFAVREFPPTEEILLDQTKKASPMTLAPGQFLSYQWTFTQWEISWNKSISDGKAAVFAMCPSGKPA